MTGTEDSRSTVDVTVDILGRANCSRLHRIRHTIEMDPIYQRQGNIWSLENKQLFIDSLLNGFDIPKIYLHDGQPVAEGKKYSIIDGKQRLEALFGFYDDEYPLSSSFEFFNVGEIASLGLDPEDLARLAGKHYSEIDREYPEVARVLDACPLTVMVVATDDVEAIEEMFSRLNEAVPLNAAEKRQAFGDPMRSLVRDVASHDFFTRCLPFSNRRYRHLDVAAKFLRWSISVREVSNVDQITAPKLDVKRAQLDRMFRDARADPHDLRWEESRNLTVQVLDVLARRYRESDRMLTSVGTVSIVFLNELLASGRREGPGSGIDREVLVGFEGFRRNRENLEPEDSDIVGALTVAEYNRLTQSPNDGSALVTRLKILGVYARAVADRKAPLAELSAAELVD